MTDLKTLMTKKKQNNLQYLACNDAPATRDNILFFNIPFLNVSDKFKHITRDISST